MLRSNTNARKKDEQHRGMTRTKMNPKSKAEANRKEVGMRWQDPYFQGDRAVGPESSQESQKASK